MRGSQEKREENPGTGRAWQGVKLKGRFGSGQGGLSKPNQEAYDEF